MQARNESSVLINLSELRAIAQQRIDEERTALERSKEAERQAKLAAERAVREAAEARVAAERAERVRIEQARADAEREMRLRVEAAEASERARHMAALEQQRMAQEMEIRRAEVLQKRPRWMIAVTAVAAAAAVALSLFAIDRAHVADAAEHGTEVAIAEKEKAQHEAQEAAKQLDAMRGDLAALDGRVGAATQALEAAQNQADRLKAKAALDEANRLKAEAQRKLDAWNAEQAHLERIKKIDLTKCSNSSLGCMKP
jgi:hypothetical protein